MRVAGLAATSIRGCSDREGVRRSLAHGAIGADCVIVEGAMGLLDGHGMAAEQPASITDFPGSTLEVARIIAAPVVLVVDAWATGETAAAAALGIKQLDTTGSVVGVILNNVPNDYRRRVIEDAIWSLARMPVLGALPHIQSVRIPELRTGLLPLLQNPHVDEAIAELGDAVARHCDLDLIERLMEGAHAVHPASRDGTRSGRTDEPVRIGVAFDDAFCFYYSGEPRAARGCRSATSSPSPRSRSHALPRDLGLIYMGGGISEAFVPRLAGNHVVPRIAPARARPRCSRSTPRAAACSTPRGSLRTSDGAVHQMAGLIPIDVALEAGTLHSGYRDLSIATPSMLGPAGTRLRGHEFHFSRLLSGGDCLRPGIHRCTTATASHSAARAGPIRSCSPRSSTSTSARSRSWQAGSSPPRVHRSIAERT